MNEEMAFLILLSLPGLVIGYALLSVFFEEDEEDE